MLLRKVLILAGMTSDGFQGDPVVHHFSGKTDHFLQGMLGSSNIVDLRERYRYGGKDAAFSPFAIKEAPGVRKICQTGVGPILYREAELAGFTAEFAPITDFFVPDAEGLRIAPHWQSIADTFDVVALSTTFVLKVPTLAAMLGCLKAEGKIVIAGGVLVNKMSNAALAKLPFDYCLKTEAEGRFSTILMRIAGTGASDADLDAVPGLLWRDGADIRISGAPFQLIAFTEQRAMPTREWVRERGGVQQYESVRGCPFRCEFCDYPYLMGNKNFRMKSAEMIFSEWQELFELGVRHIDALDSLFTVPRKRAIRLAELLIESGLASELTWACYARVTELADRSFTELMKQAGCRYIFLGVESGSQVILDNMKKLTNVAGNAAAIDHCNDVGIYTSSGILVGFPGETAETIDETKQFLTLHSTPSVHVFVWIPDFTEGSPVPVMRQDRIERYEISGSIQPATYETTIWGEKISFELRTRWEHKSMTQHEALVHASDISAMIRSDQIHGEDFSFAPYRSAIQHPALLAAKMDFHHQEAFTRGWKSKYSRYLDGSPLVQLKQETPGWLAESGVATSMPPLMVAS
jgi:radical SAM superfamily enzyme YgiQ (UPF0313 family)